MAALCETGRQDDLDTRKALLANPSARVFHVPWRTVRQGLACYFPCFNRVNRRRAQRSRVQRSAPRPADRTTPLLPAKDRRPPFVTGKLARNPLTIKNKTPEQQAPGANREVDRPAPFPEDFFSPQRIGKTPALRPSGKTSPMGIVPSSPESPCQAASSPSSPSARSLPIHPWERPSSSPKNQAS